MHLFDYSDITVSVPSNIVDSMLEIERLRAYDTPRITHYMPELAAARKNVILEDTSAAMSTCSEHIGADRISILYTERKPSSDAESEAIGYMDALEEAMDGGITALDESFMLHVHRTVTNGTTRRESRFRYRQSQDVTADPNAHAVAPIPSDDVESAVHQMIESYRMAFEVGVQPILLIPCMALDFLNIHPFSEANWRVARLIVRDLLIASGYRALAYVPLDSPVFDDLEGLYEAVSDSSEGWRKNANDPYPFVEYAVDTVLGCYREFALRYPLHDGRKLKKADRVCNLLDNEPGRSFSKREICGRLPDIGTRTADKVVSDLVTEGRIEKTGTFKDAAYRSKGAEAPELF